MKQLTDSEAKAVAKVISNLAKSEGEDIIGVLMKHGMFHLLPDEQLVSLAHKLEDWQDFNLITFLPPNS